MFFSCKLGQFLLGLGQLLPRGRILLAAQGFDFDLKLHHPPADFVQLGGHRVVLDPQPAGGLIDQVDRLVGQEAIGDVAIAQHGCGDDCRSR